MDHHAFGAPRERQAARRSGCRSVAWLMMLLILAIPTVIAWRALHTIQLRNEAAEGDALARPARAHVEAYYARRGMLPIDDEQAGFRETHGQYVAGVVIRDGKVVVTYGPAIDARIAGETLVFAAHPEGGKLAWRCGTEAGTTLDQRYRPAVCRR